MSEAARPRTGWIDLAAGGMLIALVALAGGRSLGLGIEHWGEDVPLGPAEPLPEFDVPLTDGARLVSSELEGHVTLLTFWATWCHACGLQVPSLVELDQEFDDDELRIIGINRDEGRGRPREELVAGYTSERGMDFPQVLDDGRMARAFGVSGIPHMVLIDREGSIRHVHYGVTRKGVLEGQIETLLDE